MHVACSLQVHISESSGHKPPQKVVGKRTPAQGGRWSFDKAEIAQGFGFFGVLGIFDQLHAIGSVHISNRCSHGLLNALDLVAVPLPYFGGVDACDGFTLLKP